MRVRGLTALVTFRTAVFAGLVLAPGAPAAQDAGDSARGREVFLRACQPCHDAEAGSHHVGPSLYGVIGREIGAVAGYRRYSQALKRADGTWTPARLDRYLSDPVAMFPEQRKRYDGLKSPQDRVDLIAYLRHIRTD